jgi:hypothetical protein
MFEICSTSPRTLDGHARFQVIQVVKELLSIAADSMIREPGDRPPFAVDLNRREAIGTLAVGLAVGTVLGQVKATSPPARPRVAAILRECRKTSHGQGIVDRFIEGHGWNGRFHRPPVD